MAIRQQFDVCYNVHIRRLTCFAFSSSIQMPFFIWQRPDPQSILLKLHLAQQFCGPRLPL